MIFTSTNNKTDNKYEKLHIKLWAKQDTELK